MKIKIVLISIIILVCGTLAYISTPKTKFKIKPPKIDPETVYEVVSVLDGDTLEIKIDKKVWKVRMLGIDTPETLDPRKPVQCYGKEASDKSKEILTNKSVKIEIDETQDTLDKYDRLLAYVYLDNLFVNEYLLQEGYAHEYTFKKAYEKQKEFRKIENEAKKDKKGLWLSCLQK